MKDEKIFNLEDRLVRYAGESVLFTKSMNNSYESDYYKKQLIRASGSACLNFGEAQGTETIKDFINKSAIAVKELKETRSIIKICNYLSLEKLENRNWLLKECEELIAIVSKMIINKKNTK